MLLLWRRVTWCTSSHHQLCATAAAVLNALVAALGSICNQVVRCTTAVVGQHNTQSIPQPVSVQGLHPIVPCSVADSRSAAMPSGILVTFPFSVLCGTVWRTVCRVAPTSPKRHCIDCLLPPPQPPTVNHPRGVSIAYSSFSTPKLVSSMYAAPDTFTVVAPRVADCLFGYVMRARLVADPSQEVALKVFRPHLAMEQRTATGVRVAENAQREFDVLHAVAAAPHPNLMGMHPTCVHLPNASMKLSTAALRGKPMVAALPWLGGGDMMAALMNEDMPEMCVDSVRRHFAGVASGVAHLHRLGWAHRDISLENIMLSSDGVAVLGDYGAAAPMGHMQHTAVRPGKVGYVAPEVYTRAPGGYDGAAVDVYSLGVVLFCMLARCMPYERPTPSDPCFAAILSGQLRDLVAAWGLTQRFGDGALDLVASMMAINPAKRASLQQVLSHPWCAAAAADLGSSLTPKATTTSLAAGVGCGASPRGAPCGGAARARDHVAKSAPSHQDGGVGEGADVEMAPAEDALNSSADCASVMSHDSRDSEVDSLDESMLSVAAA